MRIVVLALTLIAIFASPAFAHPGPDHAHSFADGVLHPLTGADHVFTMASVGLWAIIVGGRTIWMWPTAFLGAMLAGFVAALFGLQISFAESAITASIVVMGLLAVGGVCLGFYVRHAGRVSHPIIDLALLKIPTYAMASIGGFLFRVGLGALPFLLPLLLQVGFGLSALNSGMLTFASAAGAMLMKTSAVRVLRTLGFRIVLVGDALISAAFLFGYSLFRPSTPHLVIFFALLAGGFFRSLQMTSINTLSYADVPAALLSRATSLTSMAQQLSQTAGVATAALLLHTVLTLRGGTALTAVDFYPVFVGIAMISLLSVPFFLKMSPDAGAEVSGRPVAR